MDILLQYLDIKKNKQVFVSITDVPCSTIYQTITQTSVIDDALSLTDYLGRKHPDSYLKPYLFVGLVDAEYCNRRTIASFSYDDFCRLSCGLGEASSID